MGTTILVDKFITAGKNLIRTLDAKNFPITAALWFYESSTGNWRFLLATPKYDQEGALRVYQTIQSNLPHTGAISLQDIAVISPHNPLILLLRTAIKTDTNSISDINFNGNTINNTYIESAHIYRLT